MPEPRALFSHFDIVKSGRRTTSPPFSADWWAQMPTQVQLADCTALGMRIAAFPSRAVRNSWARCGCDPPWPLPCLKDRCMFSSLS